MKLTNDDDINIDNSTNTLVFNPYNPRNKIINEADITKILNKYNIKYKIHNIKLFRRAFVHRSYVKRPHLNNIKNNITIVEKPDNCLPLHTKSNERMEFIGDGFLECIAKFYLYKRYPKENEGFMTEKKILLVKNETIGKFAYDMGLHNWYIISKHAEEKKTRTNLKKLGCLFEAFIAALYLDSNKLKLSCNITQNNGIGFQIVQTFVESIFETHVDWTNLICSNENYKNILQISLQKEFKTTPTYHEIEVNEDTGYTMGVYLCLNDNNFKNAIDFSTIKKLSKIHNILEKKKKCVVYFSKWSHKIKKKAEQEASKIALELLDN
jgi:dsRNA-specific ribonuclease